MTELGLKLGRILRVCVCLLTLILSVGGQAHDCPQKLALMASGIPALVERSVTDLITIPIGIVGKALRVVPRFRSHRDTEREMTFWHTGRGPLEYLDLAGLYTFDFKGKQVLDVASGNGRFGQLVNLIYGNTGTKVTSLDIKQDAPFPSWGAVHVKGDAFKMPVEDKSQDLVINNWMMTYFLADKHAEMKSLMEEHLRVAKDGGEIRVGFGVIPLPKEGIQFLATVLENHPRVESYQFVSHFPLGKSLRVKLKGEGAIPRAVGSEPGKVEWKRQGLALLPLSYGVGMAATGAYLYWPSNNTIPQLNQDLDDLEDEIRKTRKNFMVNVNSKRLTPGEIKRFRKAIAVLKKFFQETPQDKITQENKVILFDDKITEPVERGGFIFVPTSKPESAFELLRR